MLAVLLTVLFSNDLTAKKSWDSRGKDFWLTFIPNYHNLKYSLDQKVKYLDTLNIYIAASKSTSGIITYRNIRGMVFTHKFVIKDTNKIHKFQLPYRTFELEGFNDNGHNWLQNQCEKIAPQSFHITSDDDISVYALNQARFTSDAFLVFPAEVLGEDYYILSYNSDSYSYNPNSRTPSQFAIVASEDNTSVTIKPSTATFVNGIGEQKITLNRGDVYLVQSKIDKKNKNPDLSGTIVKANKPIAIFSGHQRARIPVDTIFRNASRDILVEQLQPFKNWGKNAFIVPLVQPYSICIEGNDIFRIIAGTDSTKIYLNDTYITTIDEGEFFEALADKLFVIKASKPISVAQYKKTSKYISSDLNISDPYMLLIPPKEQYLNSYRIINTESWDYSPRGGYYKAFSEHYITLIVPDDALNSITVDGKSIPIRKFKPILKSGYSFINYPTSAGVHSINANAPFGIYVSGFGMANSYGYLGGMNFKQLNFRSPRIFSLDTCEQIKGILTKYSRTDYGVWSVRTKNKNNVDVTVAHFNKNDDSVRFSARLIDYRKDGKFTISVEDTLKNRNEQSFDIYGFTVGLASDNVPDTLLIINRRARPKIKSRGDIWIVNYGQALQTVNQVRFTKQEFKCTSSQSFVLQKAQKTKLEYEFYYDKYNAQDIIIDDTIKIANDCFERPIAIIRYTVIGDKDKPVLIQNAHTECDTMVVVAFTDNRTDDFGLMNYQIIINENCSVINTINSAEKYEFKIIQTDKSIDAFFKINAIDSAGNVRSVTDTIFGNMLFIEPIRMDNQYSFGERTVGFLWCDSLRILNKSHNELRVRTIEIAQNIHYGIPQSQLPFIVPPGETKSFYICFKPADITKKDYIDTITINLNCVKRKIILVGKSKALKRTGTSQCGADMSLLTKKVPKTFFIDNIYPNPVNSKGKVRFAVPKDGNIRFKIFNIFGNKVFELNNSNLQSGIYEYSLNTSELRQGVYFLVIYFNNRPYVKEFRKISH